MIRQLLIGVVAVATLWLTGCASVVNGHNQSLSVVTKSKGDDVKGANCSLTNDKGVWYVTTPGSVSVHRSYGDLTVSCKLAGLPDGAVAVKSSTTAAVFGNILIGGGIGAGIDVATGAAYNYPNAIPVDMGRTTRMDTPQNTTASASKSTSPASPSAAAAAPAVPYLNDAQQAQYRTFLTRPLPRAFAISVSGHYAATWSTSPFDKRLPTDPATRALLLCSRLAGVGCELYSVDNAVVFQALPQQPQPAGVRSSPGSTTPDPVLAAAKVPYLNEGQQAEYQIFLTHTLPRAFAISENGHYATAWSNVPLDKSQPTDPSARALAGCKRQSGQDCQLYVVDNQIIFDARSPTASVPPQQATTVR